MVGLGYGEISMNCMDLFLTGCKVGQPVSLQHNGMTNSEMEILEERRCGRQLGICSLIRKRDQQAVLYAEILRLEQKGRPCKSRHHELVIVIAGTLDS